MDYKHNNIRFINNLLNDSYTHGFPIIKELIQNANDAKAEILKVSQCNGFPEAEHKLLRNHPSLLIYNDGDFTKLDSENIGIIHGDEKANDNTVVGKYGLGMKSIFHLCDMFFYVSRITDADIPNTIEAQSLNPWENDLKKRHKEWTEFKEFDRLLLKKYYRKEYNNKGFLLIIPLKMEQEDDHIIKTCIYQDDYFGPENEFEEKVQQSLIILNATSERKSLKSVNINIPGYIVQEISISDILKTECSNDDLSPIAKQITSQQTWPRDDDEKKPSDKTTCVLIRLHERKNEKAKLSIRHSVYLPLEQDKPFEIYTKYSYALMLHGEFAIDSGRNNIRFFENIAENIDFNNYLPAGTVDEAYKHWNLFLAQQRLYPLIPEVLYKGIKEKVIDPEDINKLFSVINSEFVEKYKYHEFVTVKYNLARIFKNSTIVWDLFEANKQVYLLPENGSGKDIRNFFNDSFLIKIDKDGKLVCIPSKEEFYIFKNNTNTEIIRSIIKGFKDDVFTTHCGQDYLKKYILFLKSYLDTDILHLFAERFIDNQHPELFHSFFSTLNYELLHDFCYKYPDFSIIPVWKIKKNSKEITYCSSNDINQWIKEKRIFYEDTEHKFAELYNLLSNQIIYLNKYDQYIQFNNIGKADVAIILDNIERLVETVEFIDFYKYQDEFSLLLGRISKDQFYKLPIHKIVDKSGYHCIPINKSYRGTDQDKEKLFPKGFSFPVDKTFIDIHTNTHTFQQIIDIEKRYIPDLSGTERIRIFFEQKESINNDEGLEWIVKNFEHEERDNLSEILREKKWIPIKENGDRRYITPEVVFSDNIVNVGTITKLKSNFGMHDIYTQSDIDSEWKEKINKMEILRNINKREGLLKNIAGQISRKQDYSSEFDIESADKLFSYTEILSKISSQKLFSLLYLLFNDKTFITDYKYKENIYDELYKNLDLSSTKKDVNFYLDCIKSINTMELKENIIEIFNIWLKKLIECDNFNTALFEKLKFPNRIEKWQNSNEIIFDPDKNESNISSENELHASTNEILKEKKDKLEKLYKEIPFDNNKLLLSNASSVDEILEYFSKWLEKDIDNKLLGFLLYILRGNFQKTSYKLLSTNDRANIKTHFDYCKITTNGHWNYNMDIDEVFTKGTGFYIKIYQLDKIQKMTLGGTYDSFFNNFDMDFRYKKTINSGMTNDINIEILFKNQLQGINDNHIKRIVKYIMKYGYLQSEQQNYEKLYNKFLDSNTKYLKQTKKNLLDEIFYNIKSLSLATHPVFEQTVIEYNESRLKEENDEKIIYIKKMQEIIINNKNNAQDVLREAIKNRLTISQYDKTSIPYELFQNADDAMAQRVEHEKKENPNQCIFSINTTNKTIEFSYFGREINRSYNEETEKFYRYDLESMLSLNTSYKKGNVTGKYGLGFKSVYFVCDEPIIRSGDMHLKIIAGFYPEEEPNKELKDNETRIELKLKDNNSDIILENFKTNAYLQVVFGRFINTIKIDNDEYKWIPNPKPFFKNSNYLFETGTINNKNFLKLTIYYDQDKVNLLFKFNNELKKVEPFEENCFAPKRQVQRGHDTFEENSICKIWNTTPLGDDKTINFAINADFTVDIGRKTFVKNEQNTELINGIGESLGKILVELYRENYETLVASIFDVIIPAIAKGDKVLEKLPVTAVESFYLATKLLPTGHSSLFKYNSKPKLFSCPDTHPFFDIRNDRKKEFFSQLNNFISKSEAIENAQLITDSAHKCWKEDIYPSSYTHIYNIFILLNYLKIQQLTPNILDDFVSLVENIEIKNNNLLLSCKILLKNGNWSEINGLLKKGQSLKDVVIDEYKTESLELLQKYFNNILYKNPYTETTSETDPIELSKVYCKWNKLSLVEKEEKIRKYEKSLYPEWFEEKDLKSPDTESYNKAWFTLFAIAICQQLGRCTDEQNKDFLKFLKRKSWFDIMLNTDSESKWIKIIKEYYELKTTNQKWHMWIKLVPDFYNIRYHLIDYISIFKNLDNYPSKEFELKTILKPNTDPWLSGSGIDLPAVNITFRIGASFIIRELLRFNIYNKPSNKIFCHAFMPKEKTVNIVIEENNNPNITSREIFKVINDKLKKNDYTFDGYYDIPLLLY